MFVYVSLDMCICYAYLTIRRYHWDIFMNIFINSIAIIYPIFSCLPLLSIIVSGTIIHLNSDICNTILWQEVNHYRSISIHIKLLTFLFIFINSMYIQINSVTSTLYSQLNQLSFIYISVSSPYRNKSYISYDIEISLKLVANKQQKHGDF